MQLVKDSLHWSLHFASELCHTLPYPRGYRKRKFTSMQKYSISGIYSLGEQIFWSEGIITILGISKDRRFQGKMRMLTDLMLLSSFNDKSCVGEGMLCSFLRFGIRCKPLVVCGELGVVQHLITWKHVKWCWVGRLNSAFNYCTSTIFCAFYLKVLIIDWALSDQSLLERGYSTK